MFNSNVFFPNTTDSPIRQQSAKPLHNFSPAYFPSNQLNWDTIQNAPQVNNDRKESDDISYVNKPLNDKVTSSSSSDSEETDIMPEAAIKAFAVSEWNFGQNIAERRKSEPFTTSHPTIQKISTKHGVHNPRSWAPHVSPNVHVKPCYFGPLNLTNYSQSDKRTYFVTLEGFNISNSRRFFKLERLCQGLQSKNPSSDKDGRPFLYINLWNDIPNGNHDPENIFEPWIYALPQTHFRLVVTVNMSHAYEDAYSFDYIVDLRQFTLPSKERRTQSLEVVYSDLGNSANSLIGVLGNVITLHAQITNEKLSVPHGFRDVQEFRNSGKHEVLFDYTTVLRQVIVSLPLNRTENVPQPVFPISTPNVHRAHDLYGKRGSAIMLGQHQAPQIVEEAPNSPSSWSNFTPKSSPIKNFSQTANTIIQPAEPSIPPGILYSNIPNDTQNYTSNESGFKFKGQNQHRFSIQVVGERKDFQDQIQKRQNRYQSSDFSTFLEGDNSPLKVLEAYVTAVNKGRRGSQTSETSIPSPFGNMASKFQNPSGQSGFENEAPPKSLSIVDASSHANSMAELSQPEDENAAKSSNSNEEFKIEDYIGNIADFAKTFQVIIFYFIFYIEH